MAKPKPPDPKIQALRQRATLNPSPERVSDPLFAASEFFDARDLVQVKYEMVRRVRVDGQPLGHSAAAFGFSRPTLYQAQAAIKRGGLSALVPRKPGPRGSHKLDAEVMDFLEALLADDAALRAVELARRVRERFGRTVHPRSVERALARRKKNAADRQRGGARHGRCVGEGVRASAPPRARGRGGRGRSLRVGAARPRRDRRLDRAAHGRWRCSRAHGGRRAARRGAACRRGLPGERGSRPGRHGDVKRWREEGGRR